MMFRGDASTVDALDAETHPRWMRLRESSSWRIHVSYGCM